MSARVAEFVTSAVCAGQFPRDGLPEVAFLGRSNVGKSSLLNALAGVKNLARVSAQPGRTQQVNFFRLGRELYLVDLPGYGYARVPEAVRRSWERLATSYLVGRAPLALCVFLVDARHDPMENDRLLHAWLRHQGLPFLLAATKADKLGRGERARHLAALRAGLGREALDVIGVSATDRSGLPELWRAIRAAVEAGRSSRHPGHEATGPHPASPPE